MSSWQLEWLQTLNLKLFPYIAKIMVLVFIMRAYIEQQSALSDISSPMWSRYNIQHTTTGCFPCTIIHIIPEIPTVVSAGEDNFYFHLKTIEFYCWYKMAAS